MKGNKHIMKEPLICILIAALHHSKFQRTKKVSGIKANQQPSLSPPRQTTLTQSQLMMNHSAHLITTKPFDFSNWEKSTIYLL